MKQCVFCQQVLEDDAVFCTNCGKKQPENKNISPENTPVFHAEADVHSGSGTQPGYGAGSQAQQSYNADPGVQLGYGAGSQAQQSYNADPGVQPGYGAGSQAQQSYNAGPGTQPEAAFRQNAPSRTNHQFGRRFASWCRIGREQKSLYEASSVSEQEFMERVERQLKKNGIAAGIRQQNIVMDGYETREYVVDFHDARGDQPVSLILKYIKEGVYSYVQSGLYIIAPILPEKPAHKPESAFRSDGVFGICAGLIILMMGAGMANITSALSQLTNSGGSGAAAPLILAGLGCVGWGGFQLFEFIRWFREYRVWKKQNDAWNNAWNAWRDHVLEYVMHEWKSGKLPFVYEAVIQAVQDVCHEVFFQGPVSEAFAEVSDLDLAGMVKNRQDNSDE